MLYHYWKNVYNFHLGLNGLTLCSLRVIWMREDREALFCGACIELARVLLRLW